jgi:hypothetical protein
MGNRATIIINSKDFVSPISLYGHWSGDDNIKAVAETLRSTDRVGDANYLTAQLFHHFATKLGHYDGTLGFGIGAYGAGSAGTSARFDDNDPIEVNADTGAVEFRGETYSRDDFLEHFDNSQAGMLNS